MPDRLRLFGRSPSLRASLMMLSVAALIPSFAVIAVTQYRIGASRRSEIHELAVNSARQAAFEVDRILAGVQATLVAVSNSQVVAQFDRPGCQSYLQDLGRSVAGLGTIAVMDASGRVVCDSLAGPLSQESFSDRSYFGGALAKPGMVVGEYTKGRTTGRPILPVAMALPRRPGIPAGVLVATIDLDWLNGRLRERGVPQDGSLTVADRNGVILAREPQPERLVGTKIPDHFMRLLSAPAPGAETLVSQDGTERVLGYIPLSYTPEGLYVSAGLSAAASYGDLTQTTRLGFLLAALSGLATLAATWLVGNRMFVTPLLRLQAVLGRWRTGDRSARTGAADNASEISALGASMDRMMDAVAESEAQRELLAGELAHRVKNTLATVQAIATSTLNKQEPARDVLPNFLARIAALSRTHEVLTRERWERANLQDLLIGAVQPLAGDVNARFSIEGPALELPAREALAMTMVLHELCTNALKYGALSRPEGKVEVRWTCVPVEQGVQLDLCWRELGGPGASTPASDRGFGSRLIARAFGRAGTATLDFELSGLVCRIRLAMLEPGPLHETQGECPDPARGHADLEHGPDAAPTGV